MPEPSLSLFPPCPRCGGVARLKSGDCRDCNRVHQAKYKAANKEKIRQQSAVYRLENAASVQASRDAWTEKNRHRLAAMSKAWRDENPEKMQACRDAWVAANPEKARRLSAEWRKKHPDSVTRHNHNRRAMKLAAGGKLSTDIVQRLLISQKGKCPCCNGDLEGNHHLDHIVPLALGGTNTDDNVQLLRAKCNLEKSKKHPIDFMQERGFLL